MSDNRLKIITLELINQDTSALWTEFVNSHKDGNIFQTPQMFQVYYDTEKYFPFVHIAYREDEVCGILAGFIQKEYKGILGFLSSRCIIQGGPLVFDNNSDIIDRLLNEHNKFIRRKAIYSQIRNLYDLKDKKQVFYKNGFKYEPHLNIHINLNQSFESLIRQIHKSRYRNLKKSFNKGTYGKEIITDEYVLVGYKLIKNTYNRIKMPLPDVSHFISVFQNLYPRGYCRCIGLFYEEEMIGYRMSLTYNRMIYDYYAGSSSNHTNKYPNDVLIINMLEWGCNSEYKYFDFGGAGKPDIPYGVRDYKLNFSDNIVEFGRFEKIHLPFLYFMAKKGFELWKIMKKLKNS